MATKQQLIFSRSFSTPVTSAARMHEVMSIYAQQAVVRLARDHQQAGITTCFPGTSHFNDKAVSFPSVTLKLPAPTATRFCSPRPPQGRWRAASWMECRTRVRE